MTPPLPSGDHYPRLIPAGQNNPAMRLIQLNIQPTEESVQAYAEDAIRATRATHRMALDYSLGKLQVVDLVLGEWKRLGAPLDQINKALFGFGSYVGETIRRVQPDAAWFRPEAPDEAVQQLSNLPFLALKLTDGKVYRPINHAFLIMDSKAMEPNFTQVVRRLLGRAEG